MYATTIQTDKWAIYAQSLSMFLYIFNLKSMFFNNDTYLDHLLIKHMESILFCFILGVILCFYFLQLKQMRDPTIIIIIFRKGCLKQKYRCTTQTGWQMPTAIDRHKFVIWWALSCARCTCYKPLACSSLNQKRKVQSL